MRLIGFNFTKINAEKLSGSSRELKINTNIDISNIKELENEFFNSKEGVLSANFSYTINYEPDFAKISLNGNLLVMADQKTTKETIKQWKDKKIQEDFKVFLFNSILMKSNLKALQLEEEIGLPLHIPMPSIKRTEK